MIGKILNSKKAERFRRFLGKKSGIYLKLKRFTPSASEELRTTTILKHNNINCVIDVGANTGQFAESLYDFGYSGKVISFEPVEYCHQILKKRSKSYNNWTIAEKCAIGSENGTAMINVSDDTVFSSLLTVNKNFVNQKNSSRIIRQEEVKTYRLDNIINKYIEEKDRILLKIDTQGFEKQVLDGAPELIKKIIGIKIEIPLKPIYKNVSFTFYDIIHFLEKNGFYPYSFYNEGVNLKTGRINTIDGLFLKIQD